MSGWGWALGWVCVGIPIGILLCVLQDTIRPSRTITIERDGEYLLRWEGRPGKAPPHP